MRMPGGGTRPGYNVQLAVATEGRAIVGVDVTNAGSDVHQSQPMRRQVELRTGQKVKEQLIDGGYVGLGCHRAGGPGGRDGLRPGAQAQEQGRRPAPAQEDRQPGGGRSGGCRMADEQAKAIYKQRAATVETANGECKTYRGLRQLLVRGIDKVRCVALWSALAYNLVHFAATPDRVSVQAKTLVRCVEGRMNGNARRRARTDQLELQKCPKDDSTIESFLNAASAATLRFVQG